MRYRNINLWIRGMSEGQLPLDSQTSNPAHPLWISDRLSGIIVRTVHETVQRLDMAGTVDWFCCDALPPRRDIDLIIFPQGTPAEGRADDYLECMRRFPLARLVTVTGQWCLGAQRTGFPNAGTHYVSWNEWPWLLESFLRDASASWPTIWDGPWTLGGSHRVTNSCLPRHSTPPPRPMPVAVFPHRAGIGRALVDACNTLGWSVSNQPNSSCHHGSGYSFDSIDPNSIAIFEFCSGRPDPSWAAVTGTWQGPAIELIDYAELSHCEEQAQHFQFTTPVTSDLRSTPSSRSKSDSVRERHDNHIESQDLGWDAVSVPTTNSTRMALSDRNSFTNGGSQNALVEPTTVVHAVNKATKGGNPSEEKPLLKSTLTSPREAVMGRPRRDWLRLPKPFRLLSLEAAVRYLSLKDR
jgi:hypothetical protein